LNPGTHRTPQQMRLINVKTYALEEFYDESIPRYTILSHTWETEEISFQDMEHLGAAIKDLTADNHKSANTVERIKRKCGFRKIEYVRRQTLKDYLEYAWVDTCEFLYIVSFDKLTSS
jgi:hypothetical protein